MTPNGSAKNSTKSKPAGAIAQAIGFIFSRLCARCFTYAQPFNSRRHARPCAGHPRLGNTNEQRDVDGRDKPGHDAVGRSPSESFALLRRRAELPAPLRGGHVDV